MALKTVARSISHAWLTNLILYPDLTLLTLFYTRRGRSAGYEIITNPGKLFFNTWWLCVLFCVLKKSKHAKISVNFWIASEVLKHLRNICGHLIFSNVWKSLEIRWKSSEVTRTFPEISVMTRWKSHAFDSEKVGRYTMLPWDWVLSNKIVVRSL